MLVHHGVIPSSVHQYPFIHLGGERQCGVKFLVKGNNTMAVGGGGRELESPTSRSEVQSANQYTTVPPHSAVKCCPRFLILLFKNVTAAYFM